MNDNLTFKCAPRYSMPFRVSRLINYKLMQYFWRTLETSEIRRSAREVYDELTKLIKEKLKLEILVCIVLFKEEGKIGLKQESFEAGWAQVLQQQHWWNSELYNAVSDPQSAPKAAVSIHPVLLNEYPLFLARQIDYCSLVECVLQKSQEELFDIPNNRSIIKPHTPQKEPSTNATCHIKFQCLSEDLRKLLALSESQPTNLQLFGESLKLRMVEGSDLPQDGNMNFVQTQGSSFSFGQLGKNRFFTIWASEQIRKHYSQDVQIDDIRLIIHENNCKVYFDLLVNGTRRVHFLISFPLQRGSDQAIKDGNLCCKNGCIIVEKSQTLNFYIKTKHLPACYISEAFKHEEHREPLHQQWYRCQNFLFNDLVDMFSRGLLRHVICLQFVIKKEQTRNSDFLKFCQRIESSNYLASYFPSKQYQNNVYKDLDFKMNFNPNMKLQLQWMIASALIGKQRLVQQTFSVEKFCEEMASKDPLIVANSIRMIKCAAMSRNQRQTNSFQDFVQMVEMQNKKNPHQLEHVLACIITPSQLIPNYVSDDNFPLLNAEYHSKNKVVQILDHILKLTVRDDDFSKFQICIYEPPQKFQNKIYVNAYLREQIRMGFTLFGTYFELVGFSSSSLKDHTCYFVNQDYTRLIRQQIFDKFGRTPVVKCSHIMKIMDEYFNQILYMLPADWTYVEKRKEESKHPSRKKSKENRYTFKVMMPQAKASVDIMQKLVAHHKQIVKDQNNQEFSAFLIRRGNQNCVLVQRKNPEKRGEILFYESMAEARSTTKKFDAINEQKQPGGQGSKQPFLSVKHLGKLQIIGVASYKRGYLEMHQILNLVFLKSEGIRERVLKCTKYHLGPKVQEWRKFKAKQIGQGVPSEQCQVYEEFAKKKPNFTQEKKFKLPILDSAYLMAVYDSSLGPDEVFLQINDGRRCFVVEGQVLIFKKRYLHYDGLQVLQTVSTNHNEAQIACLAQTYKNVIVLSTHMSTSRFPFDQFDKEQRFFAVWDQSIVPPRSEINLIDCKQIYLSLKYSRKKNVKQPNEQQELKEKEWFAELQNQLVDMFALFISSQNYEELKGLYCRMMYVQLGLDEELLQQLNNSLVSNVLNTLKQVNYKYIWYADTQASLSVIKGLDRSILQKVSVLVPGQLHILDKLFPE